MTDLTSRAFWTLKNPWREPTEAPPYRCSRRRLSADPREVVGGSWGPGAGRRLHEVADASGGNPVALKSVAGGAFVIPAKTDQPSGMPPQAAACALGDPCHETMHVEFERVPPAWLRCLTEFGVSGGLKWGAELGRAPAARQAFRSQNCGQNDRWWSGCEARTDRWAQL